VTSPPLFSPQRPLLPLAVAFAIGVLLASWIVVLIAIACSVVAAGCRFRKPRLIAIGILAGFAAAGALRQASSMVVPADDISRFAGRTIVTVRGTVASDPDIHPRVATVVAEIHTVETTDGIRPCSGSIYCTLARGDGSLPDYGYTIEARGKVERPEPASNPGGFDERGYLARRAIFSTMTVRRSGGWSARPMAANAESLPRRISARLRSSLAQTAAHQLNRTEASLLAGIMVGSRTELPHAVSDDFQLTGTSHILATAGLHVGLVAWLLHGAMRRFGASRRTAAGITIVALLLYAMVAGGRPSVVRAVLVTDLFLAGYLLGREADAWNSLALAALILLVYRPGSLFDVGFQLSFATVGVIVAVMGVVGTPMDTWMRNGRNGFARIGSARRIGQFGLNLAALTVAAQVGSAPLVARYFNLASPSGVLANLLIVPALAPILALGFVLWAAGALGLPLIPEAAALALRPLLAFVMGAARTCSELPLAAFPVSSPGWMLISLYYGGVAALLRAAHVRLRAATPVVIVDEPAPVPVT
jgi:competence protein ComEC